MGKEKESTPKRVFIDPADPRHAQKKKPLTPPKVTKTVKYVPAGTPVPPSWSGI